jgi:putative ABC transport system ATP-binding protein
MSLLEVSSIIKEYRSKLSLQKVQALKGVSFEVEKGEFVAIMGESGSGKTTLLNLLATIDTPTSGKVVLNGKDITRISSAKSAAFRRNHLGFVFQDFNLLDSFNNQDNILLPLVLMNTSYVEMQKRLDPIAKALQIQPLLTKFPYELSGGQQQRIAIARALITHPDLILADEPTGALDSKNSSQVLELFSCLQKQRQTILMVTHSIDAACYASRVLFIKDGQLYHQIYKGERSRNEMYEAISNTLTLLRGNVHA